MRASSEVETVTLAQQEVTRELSSSDGLAASAPSGSSDHARSASAGHGHTSHLAIQADALKRDQMGRISVFAKLTIALCVLGATTLPVLGGNPIAKRVLLIGLAVAIVASLVLEWLTRRPQHYTEGRVTALVQLQIGAAHTAAYFFGLFGGFPAIVSLAIYVYGLGASTRNAIVCYVTLAAGQAALAGLIISGALADRGLIHGSYLSGQDQVLVCINVQLVYILALVLGRLSRRKTVAAVEQMQQAVRAIAQREALLEEARQELDRAAWVGGPGRFTEQVLGSFKLGVVIGRGAMGEVYEATNVDSGERAAIKLLQRGHLTQPGSLARFTRESRIAAALNSPNITRILDVGGADEAMPYLAMERLVGDDLAAYLRTRSRLKNSFVLTMLREIAAGLQVAHDAGIVHRDLKPHNIFRHRNEDSSYTWKILDFGVSRVVDEGNTLTAGGIVGTPAYMAPEQAEGKPVDSRADVYALGVIAYRCFTGYPAYRGKDPAAILYAVVHQRPIAPELLADVSPQLAAVLAIAMAAAPADRFATAEELADAFSEALEGTLAPRWQDRAATIVRFRPWRTKTSSDTD